MAEAVTRDQARDRLIALGVGAIVVALLGVVGRRVLKWNQTTDDILRVAFAVFLGAAAFSQAGIIIRLNSVIRGVSTDVAADELPPTWRQIVFLLIVLGVLYWLYRRSVKSASILAPLFWSVVVTSAYFAGGQPKAVSDFLLDKLAGGGFEKLVSVYLWVIEFAQP